MGFSLNTQSKILRDIHVKCQELLMCLILRGSPLDALYKVQLDENLQLSNTWFAS